MRKLDNISSVQIQLGGLAILLIAVILLIAMIAVFIFWGTIGFIGLLLLLLGFYLAWKKKGLDQVVIGLLIAGIAMILVGQYTDLEIMKFANPFKIVFGM